MIGLTKSLCNAIMMAKFDFKIVKNRRHKTEIVGL